MGLGSAGTLLLYCHLESLQSAWCAALVAVASRSVGGIKCDYCYVGIMARWRRFKVGRRSQNLVGSVCAHRRRHLFQPAKATTTTDNGHGSVNEQFNPRFREDAVEAAREKSTP